MKKLITSILTFALVLATLGTATFAWWAGMIVAPDDETEVVTIEVGMAEDVQTEIDLGDILAQTNGTLVPVGRKDNSIGTNPVEEVTFQQQVTWKEIIAEANSQLNSNVDIVTGTLKIEVGDILIDGSLNHESLVNIQIDVGNGFVDLRPGVTRTMTIEEVQTFSYRVTLTEPSNFAQYQAVAGKNIEFTITYSMHQSTIDPN